jgi:hypothetical protein
MVINLDYDANKDSRLPYLDTMRPKCDQDGKAKEFSNR